MLFGNSPAKLYFRIAISVLLLAGGFVVGHGLKIVGLAVAAWTVWGIVSRHGHADRRVQPSGDRYGS